jgi:hypothetical protein
LLFDGAAPRIPGSPLLSLCLLLFGLLGSSCRSLRSGQWCHLRPLSLGAGRVVLIGCLCLTAFCFSASGLGSSLCRGSGMLLGSGCLLCTGLLGASALWVLPLLLSGSWPVSGAVVTGVQGMGWCWWGRDARGAGRCAASLWFAFCAGAG